MKLADFWPTVENIQNCIKPEAESDWAEVFLAVHQPMRLIKPRIDQEGERTGTAVDENAFLSEFLKPTLSTGTLLMLILGGSGIGKSHLVRWLEVQLKRHKDAKQRHLIRIPKSSSLKTVLFKILDDLKDPQYDEIRRKLNAARERMDVIGAEERIRAELLAAIRRQLDDAKQRKVLAKTRGERAADDDEEWIVHGDEHRGVRALLSDPVTSQFFMRGTEDRPGIIAQLALHLTTDSSDERPPRRKFEEADFIKPAGMNESEASQWALRYLHTLDRQDGLQRKTIVRLLNDILEKVIEPLVSPTDTSLSEIFVEVRRQLLQEGRELVLLVEDFADLSGIQGALLGAMIREGVRDGQNELCQMRTALAVTSGYDFGRYDTVRTRVQFGWFVDDVEDTDDDIALEKIADYVGAYLNAARFGAEKLRERHLQDDGQWPPNFANDAELDEIERLRLDAFGRCQREWHLFPFNKAALRQMADLRLRENNVLRLNPRKIINHILIAVLENYRSEYLRGEFPGPMFWNSETLKLSAKLDLDLNDAEGDSLLRKRYRALLRFWGDAPNSLKELSLPGSVFETFGLRPIKSDAAPIEPKPQSFTPTTQDDTAKSVTALTTAFEVEGISDSTSEAIILEPAVVVVSPPPVVKSDVSIPPEIARWENELETWSPTALLMQKDANEIRKFIGKHIAGAIDWDSLLLKGLNNNELDCITPHILLPSAKGSGNVTIENAACVVCSPDDFNDSGKRAKVVRALIALTKHEYYRGWDYEDSERGYACWQNLLDELVPQATKWLLARRYHSVEGDPVPALVETLLVGARVLNVKAAHATDHASLLSAIFEPAPPLPNDVVCEEWRRLTAEFAEHRSTLQTELLARVAVRQGGKDKEHGVDAVRLIEIVRAFTKGRWIPASKMPTVGKDNVELSSRVSGINSLSGKLQTAAKKRQEALAAINSRVQTELGDNFDKAALHKTLAEVIDSASQSGLLGYNLPTAAELRKLNEEFRTAPVKESLETLQNSASENFGTQLSALAQIDDATLKLVERFVNDMQRCLNALDGRLKAELSAGEGGVDRAKVDLENELQQLTEQLNKLGGFAS